MGTRVLEILGTRSSSKALLVRNQVVEPLQTRPLFSTPRTSSNPIRPANSRVDRLFVSPSGRDRSGPSVRRQVRPDMGSPGSTESIRWRITAHRIFILHCVHPEEAPDLENHMVKMDHTSVRRDSREHLSWLSRNQKRI